MYQGFCLCRRVCHGGAVRSSGAGGPDLRESPVINDYPAFRAIVAEGALLANGMPLFDDLSEQELRGLYDYIRQQARLAVPSGSGPYFR